MENQEKRVELTEAQERAISVEQAVKRIVIAMAGSGKTTVLVEHYLALLNNPGEMLKPSEIVAVTFTDKAARSMRTKLIRRLIDEKKVPAVRELYSAPISTIHAFCANLVREYALVIGLDPDFEVIDEIKASILAEECLRETMLRWREERSDDYERILREMSWGGNPYEEFADFHDDLRSRGIDPEYLKPGPEPGLMFGNCMRRILESIEDFIKALDQKKRNDELTATEIKKEKLARDLRELIGRLEIDNCSVEISYEIFEYRSGKKIGGKFSDLIKPHGIDLVEMIRAFAKVVLYISGHDLRKTFLDLVKDFDNEYQRKKDDENLLDFDDLQDFAIKLLREDAAIAQKIRGGIKAFLIDEFQDTNPVQMTLAELLRPENRFFAVGDPRQAIYGFRHANVGIMLGEMENYNKAGGEVVPLDRNFRSREKILGFVSALFRERPIDPQYEGEIFGEILPGREFKSKGHANPVEIMVAMTDDADESREIEAMAIAGRIANILKKRMTVEERDGSTRQIQPSDIAILFRTHSNILDYARALESAGIPYHVVSGGGFHHQREVMDLVNFMELMEDPWNPLSLSEVLRAPFAGISIDGLYSIIKNLECRIEDGELRIGENFWMSGEIPLDDPDMKNWEDFKKVFADLLEKYTSLGPSERLRGIIDETHFRASVARGRGGERRLGNVGKLLDSAEAWEHDFPADNRGFINRMKELRFRDVRDEESPVTLAENSVTLMTIHASKGLEFPLVILADAAARGRYDSKQILLTDDGNVLVKRKNILNAGKEKLEDVFFEEEKENRRAKEEQEATRLIYVALTRAMEKLIVSFSVGKSPSGVFYKFFNQHFNFPEMRNKKITSITIDDCEIPVVSANVIAEMPMAKYSPPLEIKPAIDIPAIIARIEKGPPKTSKLETYYSVTTYIAWIHCPKRMYYRYIAALGGLEGKLKPYQSMTSDDDESEPSDAGYDEFPVLERGILIHELLHERIQKGDKFSFEDFVNNRKVTREEITRGLKKVVDCFETSGVGKSILGSDVRKLEEPLVFKIEDFSPLFRAVPDVAWMIDGKWRVVDFKSGKAHTNDDSTGLAYAEQVRMYARGIRAIQNGLVEKASILYVDAGNEVEVDLGEEAMRLSMERVRGFIGSIENEEYLPNPDEKCDYCDYKGACREFKN